MTTEAGITIIAPRTLAEAKEMASTLAAARTIPEALQKSPADVLAVVMAGAELGLAPMQSIRGLVLIKGKPTLSADAMGALVKSRRDVCEYLVLDSSDAQRATYTTKRVGDPKPTTMSFAIEDAQRAGLTGDNWRKFPAAMLRARALSAICRAVYPDLILGVYDPDELEAAPSLVVEKVVPAASPPLEQVLAESVAAVAPTPGKTPWDDICAAAKAAGITWQKAAAWLKSSRGKARPSDVTSDDVEAYLALLAEESRADGGGA